MNRPKHREKIIRTLFKNFLVEYNSRSLSKTIGITHAGTFKILKKLEKENIVKSRKIGKAVVYSLNMENSRTITEIELSLIVESENYNRWIEEFKKLKDKSKFVILFGSIVKNLKEAKDIDILIVTEKNKLEESQQIISERSKLSYKKIHPLTQTLRDFNNDVSNKNKAIIEIMRTGIVLYGHREVVKILRNYIK